MYYKSLFSIALKALIIITLLGCKKLAVYDLVITDGKILNYESGNFIKKNIGIKDGKILKVSDSVLVGNEVIDAEGSFVYPGFIDAHCHFWYYASGLLSVDLVGTASMYEVIERLKKFESIHPELEFIDGRGWDQNDWQDKRFPTNKLLSIAFPDKPVYLTRIDGHALLVNEEAIKIVGGLPEEVDGGEIIRIDGKETGVMIDEATTLFTIPSHSLEKIVQSLVKAESNCFEHGLTGLADAGLPFSSIKILDSLQEAGVLSMPIFAMLSDNEKESKQLLVNGPFNKKLISSNSIKVYSDGALGSRGALLLKPYTDLPEHYGLQIKHREDLKNLCIEAKNNGVQINVHAIGDSASRMVLQVFAEVLVGKNDLRWRIEHAQIINPADSIYFINYSILPSVQPTHATSDMYWAEERLGAERINHAYSYQDLYRWSGGHMPLGTDFPVEDIDPRKTLYAAVTRQDAKGFPEGGFLPKQKMSRIDALKGMTIEAAFAQFEEDEKGSIEAGKWADLFLSPVNLLQCPEMDILSAEVSQTIVRGKVVYSIKK